jgi:hypothetical protein
VQPAGKGFKKKKKKKKKTLSLCRSRSWNPTDRTLNFKADSAAKRHVERTDRLSDLIYKISNKSFTSVIVIEQANSMEKLGSN